MATIFLSNRKFFVDIDNNFSETKNIQAGTPQGSPLSPILFSLLINGIGKILKKFNLKYALFADDLTIWKIHSRINHIQKTLQTATTAIIKFFTKINLKVNSKKCQYSIFTNIRKELKMKILINNQEIEYNPNPVILGITFDKKLNFIEHFDNLTKKMVSKINLLKILSNKSNRLNTKSLTNIFKSLILSKIQYSMIPFFHTNSKTQRNLQTLQNKCLKIILGLPTRSNTKFIHQALDIEMLDKRLKWLTSNYLREASSSNQSVKDTIENTQSISSIDIISILDKVND